MNGLVSSGFHSVSSILFTVYSQCWNKVWHNQLPDILFEFLSFVQQLYMEGFGT